MTDTKKTGAEEFLYAIELTRKGILSAEEFEKQRKEIFARPVFKEDDFLGELAQWAEIKNKGGITAEEFEARKKILLAENKRSVKEPVPVATPAPAPAPVKKKKRGCGCLTVIILAAGALGLYSLIPSCKNEAKSQTNTNAGSRPMIGQTVQRSSRPVEVEQVLTQSEPWRAEFTQKMQAAGLDDATQQLLHDGMSKLSAYNEWLKQHALSIQYKNNREFSKSDRCEGYKTDLLAFVKSMDEKVKPEQKNDWNSVNRVYSDYGYRLKNGETFDPVKAEEEMIARVRAERTRQQVQNRTVSVGR